MPLYHLHEAGPISSPVLVVALDGWVNAGSAGTTAAAALAGDGPLVATFDGDALFDYQQARPTIDFIEGVMAKVAWPELTIRHQKLARRELLVLTGSEPNWNWRRMGKEVAELAARFGVVEHLSLGGIPWAAPHTRPVSIVITASRKDRISPADEHPEGLLRVPGAAVSTIEEAVAQRGIPTTGFWARVPHYVGASYLAAAVALVERVSRHLGVEVPLDKLAKEAAEQRAQLDEVVEAREDVRAVVQQLEELVDAQGVMSGEQLAAEIERYLRQQGDGPGRS